MSAYSGFPNHSVTFVMAALLLTWSSAVARPQAPGSDPQAVVANGDPPLTQGMIDRIGNFIEWAFEAPLTVEQRRRMSDLVRAAWTKNSRADIDGALEILKAEAQIAALTQEQRDLVRAKVQPDLLQKLRADQTDPANRWMLSVYDAAHAPIAPGNPPLTRQASDALAELFACADRQTASTKEKAITSKEAVQHYFQETNEQPRGRPRSKS